MMEVDNIWTTFKSNKQQVQNNQSFILWRPLIQAVAMKLSYGKMRGFILLRICSAGMVGTRYECK